MEMNTALKLEEEFSETALTLYEQALSIQVTDKPTYTAAGEFGKSLKELEKKIVDYFAPLKKAAHEAHKAITKREADELSPVREAMDCVRKSMNRYLADVEDARRKAEAAAQKAAEEEAEKERQRLLRQAEKAEAKGNEEKVEELLEKAENVYVAPVTVARDTSVKTDTVSLSSAMELEVAVSDLRAFVVGLVQKNLPPTMLEVKHAPLKAWVKANALTSFPGLVIREVPKARIR